MSLSFNVKGITKSDDAEYQKHAKVLKVCHEVGLNSLPPETAKYFGCDEPELRLLDEKLEVDIPYEEIYEDVVTIIDVFTGDIPKNITKIRFTIEY